MSLPTEPSNGLLADFQPSPSEEENRDVPSPELTKPAVSVNSCNIQTEVPEPVIPSPTPPKPTTRAPRPHYNLRLSPTQRLYQDYFLIDWAISPSWRNS